MSSKSTLAFALALAAALLAGPGCDTVHKEGNRLHSFEVMLSPGHQQITGSEEEPLTYISGTSCAENACPEGETCIGTCSVSGLPCEEDGECGANDYCSKICLSPIWIDIQAVGRDGLPYERPGTRWVHLVMVPGIVAPTHEFVQITDGKATDVKVFIAQAIGKSHLWVEDIGTGPAQMQYGECNNDLDDDGDGWVDMADPNCLGPDDPQEETASYATGLSPPFFFVPPRIWHIQYTDQVSSSPLDGQEVYVDRGSMVVTNVVANGFFLADMLPVDGTTAQDSIPPYNSFFLYTFNKPEDITYGDILCDFSGGVVEYEGNTQMTFPTFSIADRKKPAQPCEDPFQVPDVALKVPIPVDITDLLEPEDPDSVDYKDQLMANAKKLEPYESALIRIRDVSLSTRFLACDSDENGDYPSGTDDDLCRDECQKDPNCTQLESFFKYAQMAAYADIEKKIFVGIDMLKDGIPLEIPYIGAKDQSGNCPDLWEVDHEGKEFLVAENPHKIVMGETMFTEYTCPAKRLDSVAGNLRHIYLCSPKPGKKESCSLQMTMLIPRFKKDFATAKGDE